MNTQSANSIWGSDHLCDVIAELSQANHLAQAQAFTTPTATRTSTILKHTMEAKRQLDSYIAALESELKKQLADGQVISENQAAPVTSPFFDSLAEILTRTTAQS
jgi:hypothetical protein